jgi:hypothetical protein
MTREWSRNEKLKPMNPDIDFIDPITFKKVCSFNQCLEKFTIMGIEQVVKFPKFMDGKPLPMDKHYHECSECGRKHRSKRDKSKNIDSFRASVTGNYEGNEYKGKK